MEHMGGQLSPMMSHYFHMKEQYRDCILFYRLGDFYEMFFEDAETASRELELTLTGKNCGLDERAPMCGVPYHSASVYIARLVEKGYKVAICEQVEDPKLAKGIVKREVTRIITAGTLIDEAMLKDNKNNYFAVAYKGDTAYAVAVCDISTGEVYATRLADKKSVINELVRYMPSELMMNEPAYTMVAETAEKRCHVLPYVGHMRYFAEREALKRVEKQFEKEPGSLGLEEEDPEVFAIYALLCHLDETQKKSIEHITTLELYSPSQYMDMDAATRRNLEITETMRDKKKKGSLLGVLDKTKTAMGARKLMQWVEKPLVNSGKIKARQLSVAELVEEPILRDDIAESLKGIYDVSRIMTRIALSALTTKDLISLKHSLKRLPGLKEALSRTRSTMLSLLGTTLDTMDDTVDLLERAIYEKNDDDKKEDWIINPGYSEELDKIRGIMSDGTGWLAKIEAEEKEKTGIKNLKVRYNKVFGYYIEVTNSNLADVPERYIRKQTLTTGERFITPELKEIEETILGASEKTSKLEAELLEEVRRFVAERNERLHRVCEIVAVTDALYSLAETAVKNCYTMPEITEDGKISIVGGRHPVVEKMITDTVFIPNDTRLDCVDNRLIIITGPNMAGKSTYMRQVALITLMAQIGSFVPAESAKISVTDKIFTRVGASDDIASGQSTFMLEMVEVAGILENATEKSLVILDEIGRGTSTYDGLSIAWAVAEYINNPYKIGAKTLFATHYHELSELEDKIAGIKNYRVAVRKSGDNITFLRKIVRGNADDSFGIEVAALAGVLPEVIERAKEILHGIESGELSENRPAVRKKEVETEEKKSCEREIVDTLKCTDVMTLTPLEAVDLLFKLTEKAKKTE